MASMLISIIFVSMFIGAIIAMSIPLVDAIRQSAARRPWKKIQDAIDFPPKLGQSVTIDAPSYRFGEYVVPCTFTVARDPELPSNITYRLDVGDLESFKFSTLSVEGSIIQYIRDKIYAGNWVF